MIQQYQSQPQLVLQENLNNQILCIYFQKKKVQLYL